MSAQLLSFGRASGQWTNGERAELQSVLRQLRAAGLDVELEDGVADEGDPWCVLCHATTGEVIAHVARLDGRYIIDSAALAEPLVGYSLRHCAERFIDFAPLPPPRVREGAVLRLHPGALLGGLFLTLSLFVQARREPSVFDDETASGDTVTAAETPMALRHLAQQILDIFQAALRSERAVDAGGGAAMVPMAVIAAGLALVDFKASVTTAGSAGEPSTEEDDAHVLLDVVAIDASDAAVALMLGTDPEATAAQVSLSVEQIAASRNQTDGADNIRTARIADVLLQAETAVATPPLPLPDMADDETLLDAATPDAPDTPAGQRSSVIAETDAAPAVKDAEPATQPGITASAPGGSGIDWWVRLDSGEATALVDAIIFRTDDRASDASVRAADPEPVALSGAVLDGAAPLPPLQAQTVDPGVASLVFTFLRIAGEVQIGASPNGVVIQDAEIVDGIDRGPLVTRNIVFSDDSAMILTGFAEDFADLWV